MLTRSGLAGGSQGVNYTVLAGDTLTTIAAGLATAINGNANLTAIGVTATSSSTVLNIKSTSTNSTTYTKSLSGGATETIALAPASGVAQYGYNNLNELTSIATGGATKFQANTNKALNSATVNSNAANLEWSQSFSANATLASGASTIPVSATDGASNVVTNNYQVGVTGPSSVSLSFDANGNMTSDGVKTFAWDAENRLIKITYPGSGNFSQILYDANGVKGQITETVASTLTSTKQLVNSGSRICEERDASGAVAKKFFGRGQTIGGSNYFYDFDHLRSIRDMTDSSGVVQAHYEYDLYGQRTKTAGALDSDFQYAGYYMHTPSGLNLAVYRAYSPSQGRWINRDPIEEDGGDNLFCYVANSPALRNDPSGLMAGGLNFYAGPAPQAQPSASVSNGGGGGGPPPARSSNSNSNAAGSNNNDNRPPSRPRKRRKCPKDRCYALAASVTDARRQANSDQLSADYAAMDRGVEMNPSTVEANYAHAEANIANDFSNWTTRCKSHPAETIAEILRRYPNAEENLDDGY